MIILKNKTWIILIILTLAILGVIYFFFSSSSQKTSNQENSNNSQKYEASKSSTNNNSNNNESNTSTENSTNELKTEESNSTTSDENAINQNTNPQTATEHIPVEEQIATFSTKIYTKDSARQNNIQITCNTLNGTTVPNGSTFSFCNTVGPSSSSKGYQKADIYDRNGNKIKGYGGGNCQISTTLYNALLTVPSLVVTERHEHSNYVPYIQEGKDAAVAYGSYDLKFRNDSGYTVKILASASSDAVTVSLNLLK